MSVKKRGPKKVIVATPVAPASTVEMLSEDGTNVVALETPADFLAIGEFYSDFDQVEDGEVRRILGRKLVP
jgi:putative phosphoribosyl transferase